MNRPIELNGIDFLLMVQNGTLVVDVDSQGKVSGINLDDETIDKFDGMLVALHKFTNLMMETNYTIIGRKQKTANMPNQELVEKNENIEE